MKRVLLIWLVLMWASAIPVTAQPVPNAALRYWMAFAMLRDVAADPSTSALVQRVIDGVAPWDEQRLGVIVDSNAESMAIMRRATALPSCDWGVEYELGPDAPIAHLARGRALGRLNVLAGVRAAARGHANEAVETWLAGVRFAQHLASGGTVVSALSANSILNENLKHLSRIGRNSALDAEHRRMAQGVLQSLPVAGIDWADAFNREGAAVAVAMQNGAAGLSRSELPRLREAVRLIGDALRVPPDRSQRQLATIDRDGLPLPSPTRINAARQKTETAREKALNAVR